MKRKSFKSVLTIMTVVISISLLLIEITNMFGNMALAVYASEALEKESLEDSELAEPLIENGVTDTNHVERLEEKESDLNTIIYANYDGTETAYIFDEEVKYIDGNGEVQDKSNEITEAESATVGGDYSYYNANNDINTYFPESLFGDMGVLLKSDDFELEMFPKADGNAAVPVENDSFVGVKLEDNTVIYDNVFGESTELQYSTTFNGFKEDIVLYENCGNVFSFIVNVRDTYLESENGAINFIDKSTDTLKAVMSPIYVYDSFVGDVPEGETHYTYANSLEFSKISEECYEITVTVDSDFLENEATVYPVYVDPSTTVINAVPSGNKTVLDTPIYNGAGAANVASGANTTGVIGYVNASYGSGRMLMRFPALTSKTFMNSNYTILTAVLHLRDVSGQSTSATIAACNYTGPSWTESTVYSLAVWNGLGTMVGCSTFSSPSNVNKGINITPALKKWQTDKTALGKGIILKNTSNETSTAYYKSICTSESASNRPYLVVTYFYNGVRGVEKLPETTGLLKNCFCFAFNYPRDLLDDAQKNSGLKFENMTVPNALKETRNFLEGSGNKKGVLDECFLKGWRVVSGYDAVLEQNEWLVCMRVGVNSSKGYDYHFWYRANDGKWYNKHGPYHASECVEGVVNPTTANGSSGWTLDGVINFYSSETIYYAVKQ